MEAVNIDSAEKHKKQDLISKTINLVLENVQNVAFFETSSVDLVDVVVVYLLNLKLNYKKVLRSLILD